MKKILVWLVANCYLLIAGLVFAQTSQTGSDYVAKRIQFTLLNPPLQVPGASVSVSGNPGPATYYYWIVTQTSVGASSPAGPFAISTAPNTLGVSNFDVISWTTVSGGTSYDVLRTSNTGPPFGACNCAVATGITGNTVNDQANALNAYTVNTLDPSTLAVIAQNGGTAGTPTLSILGALTTKSSNSVRELNTANTQTWLGSDVGGWINSAAADVVTGRIHVAKGSYTFSTQINLDQSTGITVECDGGVSSGAAAATQLIWSGTGTPISARSSSNIRFKNCQFLWNNAAFTGPYIDTSHTGTGCGGGGCDSSGFELDHVSFFATGSGVAVPLVSLDKNINCSVHDSAFHNFASYAIRGAAAAGSYSNVCKIVHNTANSSTGDSSGAFVRNPHQTWQLHNNTLELGNAAGIVSFSVTDTGVVVDGFEAKANWAGDAGAATYVLFDFSASGQGNVAGVDISGANTFTLNTNSTYLKLPNNAQAKFTANVVTDCSKLLDLGTGDSVDIGTANSFTGTCPIIYGTNSPTKGFGVVPGGNPVIFGDVQFPSTLNTGTGSAAKVSLGVGVNNTGWFSNSNSRLQESHGGNVGPVFDNTGLWIGSGMVYKATANADPNALADSGLSRLAPGVYGVGNGTAGDVSGEIRSAKISATYNAAGTVQTGVHLVQDTCTLGTNCAVTLTGSAAFTSSSSYHCTGTDTSAAAAVRVQQASGSSVTFTGTGTDVISYHCVGN